MNKIIHIILISIISLTVLSCSSDDSKTATSSGLFVAVGMSGVILTSSDGTTWTSRTSGSSQGMWNIFYGNSTFVVVANSGTILTQSIINI